MPLSTFAWVALGGALGSVLRFAMSLALERPWASGFPYATLLVNVTGCLAIGVLASTTGPQGRVPLSLDIRLFWMVGVCGGYTTFSSFGLQTLQLVEAGQAGRATLYVVLSTGLCLGATALGLAAGSLLRTFRS